MVAATTSWPSSSSSAAATDESTPPESPTSTRTPASLAEHRDLVQRAATTARRRSGPGHTLLAAQPLHSLGKGEQRCVDVCSGRRVAERKPHVALGLLGCPAHRQ